jgi:hypothetical protein
MVMTRLCRLKAFAHVIGRTRDIDKVYCYERAPPRPPAVSRDLGNQHYFSWSVMISKHQM